MWLLSTDRAELHFFSSLEKAKNSGYAILSHVWDDVEQTFEETEALRLSGKAEDGYNPRDHSSVKVQESCILAAKHGYKWIWNDASCIDKTSSAELSEAINSMFAYYAHAEVCYAFLADVPQDGAFDHPASRLSSIEDAPFAQSRWFQRGWTLQELLAPAQVIFLSSSWSILGTKAMHVGLLSAITKIPHRVLTFEEELWDVSIAGRMSWASKRETTRIEDEAYSLMGIFDVQMPTIYGEGRNAFRRLQEELMRKSTDTTLFAWGTPHRGLPDHSYIWSFNGRDDKEMYLLATSPSDFRYASSMKCTPSKAPTLLQRAAMSLSGSSPPGIPTFEMTSYGVRARTRVFKVHGYAIADLHVSLHDADGPPLGLLLGRSATRGDPTRPLYHPCVRHVCRSADYMMRLVDIGSVIHGSAELQNRFRRAPWLEFYITHVRPKPLLAVLRNVMNSGTIGPFHIPMWLFDKLRAAGIQPELRPKGLQAPWNGESPVALALGGDPIELPFLITFGRCTGHAGRGAGMHWVNICVESVAGNRLGGKCHDCSEDHFAAGLPVYKKEGSWHSSVRGQMKVTLVFIPHPLSPTETYVLTNLELTDKKQNLLVFNTTST